MAFNGTSQNTQGLVTNSFVVGILLFALGHRSARFPYQACVRSQVPPSCFTFDSKLNKQIFREQSCHQPGNNLNHEI